jgi:cobaltochelatase CobN
VTRIALLSTSDSDLLSARASGADYGYANPAKTLDADYLALAQGADLVVYRFLGSPQSLDQGFARLRGLGKPMVVLGGEQTPDAALMELSTAPIGVAAQAHVYLAQGGAENLSQLHAFLSDTVLLTGVGFEAPAEQAGWGELARPVPVAREDGAIRPRVGILFYRAQQAAGNTAYVTALADAIDAAGGQGVPIFATSLRDAPAELLGHLGRGGGRRRGRPGVGRPRHPHAARPLPHLRSCLVGRLGRGHVAAGRRHPGGGAGVRRPDHHGSLLVQGGRRRRSAALRRRP